MRNIILTALILIASTCFAGGADFYATFPAVAPYVFVIPELTTADGYVTIFHMNAVDAGFTTYTATAAIEAAGYIATFVGPTYTDPDFGLLPNLDAARALQGDCQYLIIEKIGIPNPEY